MVVPPPTAHDNDRPKRNSGYTECIDLGRDCHRGCRDRQCIGRHRNGHRRDRPCHSNPPPLLGYPSRIWHTRKSPECPPVRRSPSSQPCRLASRVPRIAEYAPLTGFGRTLDRQAIDPAWQPVALRSLWIGGPQALPRRPSSVGEVTGPGEVHGHPGRPRRVDGVLVAHRTARLDDRPDTGFQQ